MEVISKPYSKYAQKIKISLEKTTQLVPRDTLRNSDDVCNYLHKIHAIEGNDVIEHFYVLYLNRSNKVIAYMVAGVGGITGTTADIRIIMSTALQCGAVAIVVSHNHPSGNLKPSRSDEDITHKLKECCKFHDIKLQDHMIISDTGFFSFADEGLMY